MRPFRDDPAAIRVQAEVIAMAEGRLARFPADQRSLMAQVIAACGMVEVADRLIVSPAAVTAGRAALAAGAAILCDGPMVAAGIAPQRPARNPVIAPVQEAADGAIDLWLPHLAGSVVGIGTQPLALFRLLDHLDRGGPHPALIVACPAGLVDAAAAKAELVAHPRGCAVIVLRGRRGGPALAAAAVTALLDPDAQDHP
ncbi:precorrin-8X methylmutase [Loktanella fryxellensis]|uniref:Precorrin-8X methylmutase n=1 Tax=Loktanella fryxellensis TaxID=245187 RepID=A0A1H8B0C7_9RHOB|nr:precorrin-8X methylmutase [Loktanella fryxellensis]SEM75287.1 precorrin-8X methylmutase [Loktanella fryxellensis]